MTVHQPLSGKSALEAVARFLIVIQNIIKQSVNQYTLLVSHGHIVLQEMIQTITERLARESD